MKVLEDNKQYTIGFVILHYNAIKETRDCIHSIFNKIDTPNYKIVVVDNNSPNGTGKQLYNQFSNTSNVEVILSEENLGFARGNNLGFMHLKDEKRWDFICMLNNDTCIIQENFLEIIKKEYEISQFGLLGPLILLNNNTYNPIDYHGPKYKNIKKSLIGIRIARVLNYLGLRSIFLKISSIMGLRIREDFKEEPGLFKRHENIKLHGCCWVFSPAAITQINGLNPITFMFREEEFLYLEMRRKGLKTVYNPELKIRHFEDAATDTMCKTSRQKNEFLYKHSLYSTKALLQYMKDEQLIKM
jgi:Predicted glycosyltransferases